MSTSLLYIDEVNNGWNTKSDWNSLNDKKKIEIIERYSYKMNIYTIIFKRKGKKDIFQFFL